MDVSSWRRNVSNNERKGSAMARYRVMIVLWSVKIVVHMISMDQNHTFLPFFDENRILLFSSGNYISLCLLTTTTSQENEVNRLLPFPKVIPWLRSWTWLCSLDTQHWMVIPKIQAWPLLLWGENSLVPLLEPHRRLLGFEVH
jgi:hypothetical protein